MKKMISSILMATAILAAFSVKAQTAEEIVNKHIEAMGGKDKIKQVNSIYMEGTVNVMGGDNPTTVTILNGKGYKTESDFNGQKAIQCYSEKGGWSVNPMGGGAAEPMPDDIYNAGKEQMDIGGALFDYTAKGSTVELLGKEGSNFKLRLTTKDKAVSTYYIDQASYYISKVVKKGSMMGQEIEVTVSLADYRKTDIGFPVPYTINMDLGQFQLATTIKSVALNKSIDPAVFAMPK